MGQTRSCASAAEGRRHSSGSVGGQGLLPRTRLLRRLPETSIQIKSLYFCPAGSARIKSASHPEPSRGYYVRNARPFSDSGPLDHPAGDAHAAVPGGLGSEIIGHAVNDDRPAHYLGGGETVGVYRQ